MSLEFTRRAREFAANRSTEDLDLFTHARPRR